MSDRVFSDADIRMTYMAEWERISKLFGLERAAPMLRVTRTTRQLGRCCQSQMGGIRNVRYIGISKYIATKEVLIETVRHEMAHAVNWLKYGRGGHGDDWKGIARACGATPERCIKGEMTKTSTKNPWATFACQGCSWKRTYYRAGSRIRSGAMFPEILGCPACGRRGLTVVRFRQD